ncbi:MAG: quinolinate synthase NadA [Deltaproteobacteria bacterium]|jgi:quinolinate synthase|nr:quinolinate synthase NadA [Deltaproteobacteria bacterium]MBW2530873.1 quinolinate synthase NadA [Deltaproteobacteria bacterium]
MTPPSEQFPSLIIRPDELEPQGAFAEAQAAYLTPDPAVTQELTELLRRNQIGVVAHFYMDPELQGVLSASEWPHIHISDSLAMADRAIGMVEAGVKTIVVLGVDFMSENVRAMLDAAGHDDVPVYRVASEPIGCTLADAAHSDAYRSFLEEAARTPASLHVIYINTSLLTKAEAHHLLPTLTCTSSNVVKTVLQATSQMPELSVWYGPDSYMGDNLRTLFEGLAGMDERAVAAVHPSHTPATVERVLERYHHFDQGTCVVHDLFGQHVVETVEERYPDVFITAHLEVPGEMFRLAFEAQMKDRGVIGSTSNILSFIGSKVDGAASLGSTRSGALDGGRLRFILGTEAGMVTSIVRRVQSTLRDCRANGGPHIEAEIIFPVAAEAVSQTDDAELAIVPGAGAEGCSTAGGCATCPYMKMNSLQALLELLPKADRQHDAELEALRPRKYVETIGGRAAADLGGEPILHMRHFQRTGALSDELVTDIRTRNRPAS